ncbi:MAG TPA: asparagine synthase-related protein, partial [Acidobacteriota bacterium]|nr:asparagine synthase-related protein [Acidobacteriota bacterium]
VSDGYAGVEFSYEIYLNRRARDIAPIRITGNYGGELLRSIQGILRAGLISEDIFNSEIVAHAADAQETLRELYQSSDNHFSFNLFKEIPWYRNSGLVCEQAMVTPRSPYLDNDLVSLMYRAPNGVRDDVEVSLRLIADGNQVLGDIPTDRGIGGNRVFPFAHIASAYGEFTFKAEYAFNYGMPQWLARINHWMEFAHPERLFLGRHKFAHFRVWYRDQLASFVKEILLDEKTLQRGVYNNRKVEEIVQNHTDGRHNYTNEISQLLSIELIHRLLVEKTDDY